MSDDTPLARSAEAAVQVRYRSFGADLPRPTRTRVITVANQKGGVGVVEPPTTVVRVVRLTAGRRKGTR